MSEVIFFGKLLFGVLLALLALGLLVRLMALYTTIINGCKYRKNESMRYGRDELTKSFNEKASKLILQADSPEKALLLSDEIVEIILTMRDHEKGFRDANSMLDDINNSLNNGN